MSKHVWVCGTFWYGDESYGITGPFFDVTGIFLEEPGSAECAAVGLDGVPNIAEHGLSRDPAREKEFLVRWPVGEQGEFLVKYPVGKEGDLEELINEQAKAKQEELADELRAEQTAKNHKRALSAVVGITMDTLAGDSPFGVEDDDEGRVCGGGGGPADGDDGL